METLESVEDLSQVKGSVVVQVRGGGRGFVEGHVRAVHEETREISVSVPSLGQTFDFSDHEVWDGRWIWVAFGGRQPMKVFINGDSKELLGGEYSQFECFAFDAEGMLHMSSLTIRLGSLDYVLAPS